MKIRTSSDDIHLSQGATNMMVFLLVIALLIGLICGASVFRGGGKSTTQPTATSVKDGISYEIVVLSNGEVKLKTKTAFIEPLETFTQHYSSGQIPFYRNEKYPFQRLAIIYIFYNIDSFSSSHHYAVFALDEKASYRFSFDPDNALYGLQLKQQINKDDGDVIIEFEAKSRPPLIPSEPPREEEEGCIPLDVVRINYSRDIYISVFG